MFSEHGFVIDSKPCPSSARSPHVKLRSFLSLAAVSLTDPRVAGHDASFGSILYRIK